MDTCIFSCKQDENEVCNSFVNKSNNTKLLVVIDSTKNVESVCCEQSNKINFRLFNYFAKKRINDKLKVVLSNNLQAGKALQK